LRPRELDSATGQHTVTGTLIALLGTLAGLTSALRTIPQAWHTLARGRYAGLSLTAMATATTFSLGWVAWAVLGGFWIVAASSTLSVIGYGATAIAIAFRTHRRALAQAAGVQLAAVAAMVAAFVLFGGVGVGWVAAAGSAIQFLPQAVTAWRSRDVSGVSPYSAGLSLANDCLWLAYAVLTASWELGAPYVLRLPITVAILARLVHSRLRPGYRASALPTVVMPGDSNPFGE